MRPWGSRPREIRNLFNPAFCGVVLVRAILGFQSVQKEGMPFSLTLLVLPLCLHKDSRLALSAGKLSYLSKIVQANPAILVGLASRTQSLLPYTLEAFGLLMHLGAIGVRPDGRLQSPPRCIPASVSGTPETRECQLAARGLGKKFAQIGDRVTIYTTLGLRP